MDLRVLVVNLAGETVFGPEMFQRPLFGFELRARVRVRIKKTFRLVHGENLLADGEPLQVGDDEGEVLLNIVFVSHTVVTWGDHGRGGDSSNAHEFLAEGVVSITGNLCAFAALKTTGQVVTWGRQHYGGDSEAVADRLTDGVVSISKSGGAFAALKEAGEVVAWGSWDDGGDDGGDDRLATGVVSISDNGREKRNSFAALKEAGEVVVWGFGVSPAIIFLDDVISITGDDYAFAALKSTGQVLTWGDDQAGGDSTAVADRLADGVVSISAAPGGAFAALKNTGQVVAWGDTEFGGDCSAVMDRLADGVVSISVNYVRVLMFAQCCPMLSMGMHVHMST
jgi:hypothetical protein